MLKLILVIFALIIIFPAVSFVRHKICCAYEEDLLTPLGELVEVNGHNMSIYVEGKGNHTLVFMSGGGRVSQLIRILKATNQCVHWCANPPDFPAISRISHS